MAISAQIAPLSQAHRDWRHFHWTHAFSSRRKRRRRREQLAERNVSGHFLGTRYPSTGQNIVGDFRFAFHLGECRRFSHRLVAEITQWWLNNHLFVVDLVFARQHIFIIKKVSVGSNRLLILIDFILILLNKLLASIVQIVSEEGEFIGGNIPPRHGSFKQRKTFGYFVVVVVIATLSLLLWSMPMICGWNIADGGI